MKEVVIASIARTPIGSFQGTLSMVPAVQLGATAIRSAVSRAEVKPSEVDEVVIGHVITAGAGQAPARQAALAAGLGHGTPCSTVNKVCGSGLKAVMLAKQAIQCGAANSGCRWHGIYESDSTSVAWRTSGLPYGQRQPVGFNAA